MAPAKMPIKARSSVLSTNVAFPRLDIMIPLIEIIFYPGWAASPKRIVGCALNPVKSWFAAKTSSGTYLKVQF